MRAGTADGEVLTLDRRIHGTPLRRAVTRTAIVMVILLAIVPPPLVNDFAFWAAMPRARWAWRLRRRVSLPALAACLTATATMTTYVEFRWTDMPHTRMLGFRLTMPHMVIRRWQGAFTGLCRLVRAGWRYFRIPAGLLSLYWRAVLYLFATQTEPVKSQFMSGGGHAQPGPTNYTISICCGNIL